MHLLAATPGALDDGAAPVDPGQTPAEVVILSAADSDLALLSAARAAMDDPPGLRLTNLMHLRHPVSVDLHLDRCALGAKLVIARVLGGAGYWRYGLEQFSARLGAAGIPFAVLPGDDRPDPDLAALSTVEPADRDALWAYFVEGGPVNAGRLLACARAVARGEAGRPPAPAVLLRAGLHWPGIAVPDLDALRARWPAGAPVVPIVFYRALVQGGDLAPIDALVDALLGRGFAPMPIFVASLKDPVSAATVAALFARAAPDVILNATAFAVGGGGVQAGAAAEGGSTPLDGPDARGAPVLQVVLSGATEAAWEDGPQGLGPRDIAMNVALPEIDGRVLSRAVSFKGEARRDAATECTLVAHRPRADRVAFVADLAAAWAGLRRTPPQARRVALVLANYPNRDGRMANGVGLDTPASTVAALRLLAGAGYALTGLPKDAAALMAALRAGPTNRLDGRAARQGGACLPLADYRAAHDRLPEPLRAAMAARWGEPEADPFCDGAGFTLAVQRFGNAVVAVQPARGYNIDPEATYHAPDLVPPHNYLAFYVWLRDAFGAQAIVHMGKHGTLEWLPGKALALSATCWPEAVLGPLPHVYPFIVNDPGEGSQAKRRAQAVIVDHLTPPLTRAESYGPLRDLEALVDEYYEAASLDARRAQHLRGEILSLAAATGIDADAGIGAGADSGGAAGEADLARLDAWLCEIKEAQIRDGLHVFGRSPEGRQERDLLLALARIPRGAGQEGDASLPRALAADLALGFDPLDCDMAAPWSGPRPAALAAPGGVWRSAGDTVERLEALAAAILDGDAAPPGPASAAVCQAVESGLRPALRGCGPAEGAGLLSALAGHFVAPGASGAPTRGRPDVLPTGRNFYSLDSRSVPTRTAWTLGWKSAGLLIERHLQDHGDWPRAMFLTAWGTATMRTGGDDIAQALALMGVRPVWDAANRRVTGFEIIPAGALGRPRVDVTLRVSGFFRDAFPTQIDLVDSAARAVMALDEPTEVNPAAACAAVEGADGGFRVFGSKPGAYGAGLQAMIDERLWAAPGDLAEAYLAWGGYAYGRGAAGRPARAALAARLGQADAVVQNQDNREHDLLDSDDYYQFEGGAAAAAAHLQGRRPAVYHTDHSRPERPVIRSLEEEIGRVVRARAVNPKWIDGVRRHGYKGAFEIAATVDYLFAFAATTGAVRDAHFDAVEAAYLGDRSVRGFMAEANPDALREMAERLQEALDRGLWQPRSNAARDRVAAALAPAPS